MLVHAEHGTQLIAAAQVESEKAGERSWSRAGHETAFAESNCDFSAQTLSALGGIRYKLEHTGSPVVCNLPFAPLRWPKEFWKAPCVVARCVFLWTRILSADIMQEETPGKPCQDFIWLLPQQKRRGSGISPLRYYNYRATVKQYLPRILQLLFHFPPLVKSRVKKLQEHGLCPGM